MVGLELNNSYKSTITLLRSTGVKFLHTYPSYHTFINLFPELVQIKHKLQTVRVELYNSYDDSVRLFMEIALSAMIFGMLLFSFYQMYETQREKGNALRWFSKSWNVIDFLSNALLASCMIIWWIFASK